MSSSASDDGYDFLTLRINQNGEVAFVCTNSDFLGRIQFSKVDSVQLQIASQCVAPC